MDRYRQKGLDIRNLSGLRLCAIGKKTAEAVGAAGMNVDACGDVRRGFIKAFARLSRRRRSGRREHVAAPCRECKGRLPGERTGHGRHYRRAGGLSRGKARKTRQEAEALSLRGQNIDRHVYEQRDLHELRSDGGQRCRPVSSGCHHSRHRPGHQKMDRGCGSPYRSCPRRPRSRPCDRDHRVGGGR